MSHIFKKLFNLLQHVKNSQAATFWKIPRKSEKSHEIFVGTFPKFCVYWKNFLFIFFIVCLLNIISELIWTFLLVYLSSPEINISIDRCIYFH